MRTIISFRGVVACLVAVLALSALACPGADVFPDVALTTESIDSPPDWVVKKGNAEYQHWTLQRDDGSSLPVGKVFIGNSEAAEGKILDSLECDLGTFAWYGRMEPSNTFAAGWFPALNSLETPDSPADFNMDVGRLLGRHVVVGEGDAKGNDGWFFNVYGEENEDGISLAGYGGVRLNGKWIFGDRLGQSVDFMGKTLVWKGPWSSRADDGIYGWQPADSMVGDDIYEFAGKWFGFGDKEATRGE